ncbi:hypothetical protein [Neptuniibacter sp. UBA6509]|uniref:hypothetical protein n=1 Tax=Neptuniibacter sp. UBA6509 TaxID=1946976 RepID=UPI0026006063|nr:hypothetical protein [Neptuniibacter sp. UBA6509]|tara:strand:+ start:1178 stop:1492 length:315 start_codon:yes stop_codon:yes gene_type:complete
MDSNIWEGIVVGASGGAIAGLTVYIVQYLHEKIRDAREMKRVNKWLEVNSMGGKWRSTRAIASWTNLTEDRVQYLCSKSEAVQLSTGENEGLWGHRDSINRTDC